MPTSKLTLSAAVMAAFCFTAPVQAASSSHAVANFASCKKPQYPQASLTAKHEGSVDLKFLVDATGAVKDAIVDKSSGYEPLDFAARDAIKLCSFKPATKNGKPVEDWVQVRYVWTLK
jgi:bla regulator protein BlaR1